MKQEITKKLSLHPLNFDEAITDVLKIKPAPKPPAKRKARHKDHERPKGK